MLTLLGNIFGAALVMLEWLFSPVQVKKRKEADIVKVNKRLREAIAAADADAVSARIDELRQRSQISARNK